MIDTTTAWAASKSAERLVKASKLRRESLSSQRSAREGRPGGEKSVNCVAQRLPFNSSPMKPDKLLSEPKQVEGPLALTRQKLSAPPDG